MVEKPPYPFSQVKQKLKTIFGQTTPPAVSKETTQSVHRTDFLKHAPIINPADKFEVKKELQKGYTLTAMYNEILEYYHNNKSEIPENTTPEDLTAKIIGNFKQELVNELKAHGLKKDDAVDFWHWRHTNSSLQAPQILLLKTPKGAKISHQGIIDKNIAQEFAKKRKDKRL